MPMTFDEFRLGVMRLIVRSGDSNMDWKYGNDREKGFYYARCSEWLITMPHSGKSITIKQRGTIHTYIAPVSVLAA